VMDGVIFLAALLLSCTQHRLPPHNTIQSGGLKNTCNIVYNILISYTISYTMWPSGSAGDAVETVEDPVESVDDAHC
jgi:hypothetical protein